MKISKHPIYVALIPIFLLFLYLLNDTLLSWAKGTDRNLVITLIIVLIIVVLDVIVYYFINRNNKYKEQSEDLYKTLSLFIEYQSNEFIINESILDLKQKNAKNIWYLKHTIEGIERMLLNENNNLNLKLFVTFDITMKELKNPHNLTVNIIKISNEYKSLNPNIYILNPLNDKVKVEIWQRISFKNVNYFSLYDDAATIKLMGILLKELR